MNEDETNLENIYNALCALQAGRKRKKIYQVDPKRIKADGSFPEFFFRSWSEKNQQIKWLYNIVYLGKKGNAKKVNISFAWPFIAFLNFCRATNYHKYRGHESNALNIDRPNNLKGYGEGNVQCLTQRQNIIKYHTHDIKLGKRENDLTL